MNGLAAKDLDFVQELATSSGEGSEETSHSCKDHIVVQKAQSCHWNMGMFTLLFVSVVIEKSSFRGLTCSIKVGATMPDTQAV